MKKLLKGTGLSFSWKRLVGLTGLRLKITHTAEVVILGHGRFGQQVNSLLMACGFHTTVIDNHVEMIEGLAKFGIQTYYGDATRPDMLKSIGLKNAKMLVICLANEQASTKSSIA